MKQRDCVSTLSAIAVCGLVLAGGMSPHLRSLVAVTADHRAQERTAVDIDNVGRGMFSWLTDQVGAAAAGQSQMPASTTISLSEYPEITHGTLESLLVPGYLRDIPELDGWNHAYAFHLNTANPLAAHFMAIRSPGRDGSFSGSSYTVGTFEAESFDEDLVWADGYQVRWPRLHRTDHQAQKRTVKDIDGVGRAMFDWLTDQVGFAADGKAGSSQAQDALTVHFPDYPEISRDDLNSLLVPQYIQDVPELDGWYQPYDYRLNSANPLASHVMAIRSAGRDGEVSGDTYLRTELDPGSYDEDLVWADGKPVRWPRVHLTDRQAQERTVAQIEEVGTAMFRWLSHQLFFAADGKGRLARAQEVISAHFPDYPQISHQDLSNILVPQYMSEVPEVDGWNHSYDYRLDSANPLAAQVMAIRSPGRDGGFSGDSYLATEFDFDNFDEDIVWADGRAVQWPRPLVVSDHEAQKRTVGDIRNVGTAMFIWLVDQVGFAAGGSRDLAAVTAVHFPSYPAISHAELASILIPQYMSLSRRSMVGATPMISA